MQILFKKLQNRKGTNAFTLHCIISVFLPIRMNYDDLQKLNKFISCFMLALILHIFFLPPFINVFILCLFSVSQLLTQHLFTIHDLYCQYANIVKLQLY